MMGTQAAGDSIALSLPTQQHVEEDDSNPNSSTPEGAFSLSILNEASKRTSHVARHRSDDCAFFRFAS